MDVAEQGDELRAPGGTVFVVGAIGAGGGDDGADADETLLCNKKEFQKINELLTETNFFFFFDVENFLFSKLYQNACHSTLSSMLFKQFIIIFIA